MEVQGQCRPCFLRRLSCMAWLPPAGQSTSSSCTSADSCPRGPTVGATGREQRCSGPCHARFLAPSSEPRRRQVSILFPTPACGAGLMLGRGPPCPLSPGLGAPTCCLLCPPSWGSEEATFPTSCLAQPGRSLVGRSPCPDSDLRGVAGLGGLWIFPGEGDRNRTALFVLRYTNPRVR